MKVSKLLVLGALWLVGLGANAAIVNGVRQAPDITTIPFQVGASAEDAVYLYNTAAGMFYTQGNTWGTRACVGPHASAVKVYFEASADVENAYVIHNYVCARSANYFWAYLQAESGGNNLYADQTSLTWGRSAWNVVPTTGNGFRIQTTTILTETGGFMGYDKDVVQDFYNAYDQFKDDAQRYPVSAELTEGEGHYIEWALVNSDVYEASAGVFEVFAKAQELKVVLDEAKAKGVNVSAEEAVYLNESSTLDEITAAIASVKEKIKKAAEENATPENQQDMTSAVTNPSYSANNTGWEGSPTPGFGFTAAEYYEKNYNHYQTVTNLPNGVYAVKVKGFFRPGSNVDAYAKWESGTDLNAKVYAVAGADSLDVSFMNIFAGSGDETLNVGTEMGENGLKKDEDTNQEQVHWVPNNMEAAEAYMMAGRYQNVVYMGTDDGTLRIGVNKNDSNFGMNWTIWDDWQLSFLGNSAEAFGFWINEVKKTMPDFSNVTDVYTAGYLTAYNDAVANMKATTKAEASAAIKAAQNAKDAFELNIQLWKEFAAALEEANEVINDATLRQSCRDDVDDWLFANETMNNATNRNKYTNEQIEAAVNELRDLILTAQKNPVSERDMTSLLVNPDFQNGEAGWTGFREGHRVKYGDAPMPVTGGTASNTCAEAFSTDKFDLYQVVENAPVGVYEISVQGFCRNGRGDNAWNNYVNQTTYSQPGKFPVYVYLNAKQTPFVSVFSEPVEEGHYKAVDSGAEVYVKDGQEYPDGMRSSAVAFAEGMYVQKAYGLVAKDGDPIRIGVKGTSAGLAGEDDNWVIFDNFKLTFKGFQADVIKPVLDDEITKAEEKAQENMGKEAYDALSGAITAAKAATAGENGEAMFESLSDLFDAEAAADASILAFAPLSEALEKLQAEIEIYMDQNPTAAAAAGDLYGTIQGRLTNHDIADSEIEGLINDINAAITAMKMPAYDGASDDNPIDMTKVLVNTTFDEGVSGWNGTTAGYNAERGAVGEFFDTNFDFYQTVSGLPEGTYQLAVQGFYRAGYADYDYQKRDSLEFSHAFLYAQSIGEETVTSSKQLMRLNEILNMPEYLNANFEAASTDELPADHAIAYTDTIAEGQYVFHLVPDMINTANDVFMEGMFAGNVVTVKLAEGAKLRVGLKKETLIGKDWTIFDNFTLTYFGKNSAKVADGDISGVQDINLNDNVKFEYFTLDGRKATAVQKGIVIQKMTLSNGAVVVRKVRR